MVGDQKKKGEMNRLVFTRALSWHTICSQAHPVIMFPKGRVSLLLLLWRVFGASAGVQQQEKES